MILLSLPLLPMIVGRDIALRSLIVFLPLVASILVSLRSMRRGKAAYLQWDKVRPSRIELLDGLLGLLMERHLVGHRDDVSAR